MIEPLSVNQALCSLERLAGEDVSVTGVLSFDFEDASINHWPSGERDEGYKSSIWLSTGSGSLQFDMQVCKRLSGKRVLVQGRLFRPDSSLGGCGHFSMWPAEILVRSLQAELSVQIQEAAVVDHWFKPPK